MYKKLNRKLEAKLLELFLQDQRVGHYGVYQVEILPQKDRRKFLSEKD